MEFPFSYTYRHVCRSGVEPEALLKEYESTLLMEGARDVRRNGPSLVFSGAPLLRAGAWRYSPLQLVSEGLFEASKAGAQTELTLSVSYAESALYLVLVSFMGIGVPGLFTSSHWMAVAAVTIAGWMALTSGFYFFAKSELQSLVGAVDRAAGSR